MTDTEPTLEPLDPIDPEQDDSNSEPTDPEVVEDPEVDTGGRENEPVIPVEPQTN